MGTGWRRRDRGQTIVLAAVAMVSIVGALAIVVDQGIFYVVQRQFEAAADAGALAGSWHDPVCPAAFASEGCLVSAATPAMVTTSPCDTYDTSITAPCAPCTTGFPACDVALANANTVAQLCASPPHGTVATGTTLVRPHAANTIVVIVQCTAGYSFGRILNLATKQIRFGSAAAMGGWNNGDIGDFPTTCVPTTSTPCLIGRLID
jgi:uncharacterized membrane protein